MENEKIPPSIVNFINEFDELLDNIVNKPFSQNPIIMRNPNTDFLKITKEDVEGFKKYLLEVYKLTRESPIKEFNDLIKLLYKLMKAIESKNQEIRSLNLDKAELEANLEGFSLDHPSLYNDRYNIKVRNPFAEELKKELELEITYLESRKNKGQAPTKANKVYKVLAFVHKTLNERFDRKQMNLACEFLLIKHPRYCSWIAGKDKYGNINKIKFNGWYNECSGEMMDGLEAMIKIFLKDRTRNINSFEITSLDLKSLLKEHLQKFS